ncbi:hypothetical protein EDD18DRAFT_1097833 [Armillaria luteobubalina]|uniref:Uncharacterized protein n=1 Tax=Armillaria luteobubalina TaxID=153913 RepID=A0AA39QP53_9AGAR|nr:hypothetical protein EDD18DRAFT_1097833 [Armillaria luteobubalina]
MSRLYRLIKIVKCRWELNFQPLTFAFLKGPFVMSTREMVSDPCHSSTHAPPTETLYGDFRLLEQECKNLEKRAVRAEGTERQTQETLNRLTLKYHEPWCQRRSYTHSDQAQSKTQNTEESLTQLMHMHCHALACLKNAEESIDGLKDDLKDARNGDWYFWDFVNELHCGICNKDLNGAYSLACRDTFHGTCLWQWFEENVREHIIDTALRQVEDVQEGPFYNHKVVNLLQMLGSEEE